MGTWWLRDKSRKVTGDLRCKDPTEYVKEELVRVEGRHRYIMVKQDDQFDTLVLKESVCGKGIKICVVQIRKTI